MSTPYPAQSCEGWPAFQQELCTRDSSASSSDTSPPPVERCQSLEALHFPSSLREDGTENPSHGRLTVDVSSSIGDTGDFCLSASSNRSNHSLPTITLSPADANESDMGISPHDISPINCISHSSLASDQNIPNVHGFNSNQPNDRSAAQPSSLLLSLDTTHGDTLDCLVYPAFLAEPTPSDMMQGLDLQTSGHLPSNDFIYSDHHFLQENSGETSLPSVPNAQRRRSSSAPTSFAHGVFSSFEPSPPSHGHLFNMPSPCSTPGFPSTSLFGQSDIYSHGETVLGIRRPLWAREQMIELQPDATSSSDGLSPGLHDFLLLPTGSTCPSAEHSGSAENAMSISESDSFVYHSQPLSSDQPFMVDANSFRGHQATYRWPSRDGIAAGGILTDPSSSTITIPQWLSGRGRSTSGNSSDFRPVSSPLYPIHPGASLSFVPRSQYASEPLPRSPSTTSVSSTSADESTALHISHSPVAHEDEPCSPLPIELSLGNIRLSGIAACDVIPPAAETISGCSSSVEYTSRASGPFLYRVKASSRGRSTLQKRRAAHDRSTAEERRRVNPAKFFCSLCPQSFTTKINYESHVLAHRGEKPFRCPHAGCTSAFTRESDMKRHVKVHDPGRPLVSCSKCGQLYTRKDTLRAHDKKCQGMSSFFGPEPASR